MSDKLEGFKVPNEREELWRDQAKLYWRLALSQQTEIGRAYFDQRVNHCVMMAKLESN